MHALPEQQLATFKKIYELLEPKVTPTQSEFFQWAENLKHSYLKANVDLLGNVEGKAFETFLKDREYAINDHFTLKLDLIGDTYEITLRLKLDDDFTFEIGDKLGLINSFYRWCGVQMAHSTKIGCYARIDKFFESHYLHMTITLSDKTSVTAFNANVTLLVGLKLTDILFDPEIMILIDNLYTHHVKGSAGIWSYNHYDEKEKRKYSTQLISTMEDSLQLNLEKETKLFHDEVTVFIGSTTGKNGTVILNRLYIRSSLNTYIRDIVTEHPFWDFLLAIIIGYKIDQAVFYKVNELKKYEPMFSSSFTVDVWKILLERKAINLLPLVENLHVFYRAEEIVFDSYQHEKFSLK